MLPSQIQARNQEALQQKAAQLDAQHGAEIQRRLEGLNDGEKALVSAALVTGHGRDALAAVQQLRLRRERERQQTAEPMPTRAAPRPPEAAPTPPEPVQREAVPSP